MRRLVCLCVHIMPVCVACMSAFGRRCPSCHFLLSMCLHYNVESHDFILQTSTHVCQLAAVVFGCFSMLGTAHKCACSSRMLVVKQEQGAKGMALQCLHRQCFCARNTLLGPSLTVQSPIMIWGAKSFVSSCGPVPCVDMTLALILLLSGTCMFVGLNRSA